MAGKPSKTQPKSPPAPKPAPAKQGGIFPMQKPPPFSKKGK